MPGAYGVYSLLEMAVAYMLLRLFCVGKCGVVQEEEASGVSTATLNLNHVRNVDTNVFCRKRRCQM